MIDTDLTSGPISGHFRRLAIPAAVGMLFSTLYNIVDTFYAGYFGTQAQAGLAVGFQAFFILAAYDPLRRLYRQDRAGHGGCGGRAGCASESLA